MFLYHFQIIDLCTLNSSPNKLAYISWILLINNGFIPCVFFFLISVDTLFRTSVYELTLIYSCYIRCLIIYFKSQCLVTFFKSSMYTLTIIYSCYIRSLFIYFKYRCLIYSFIHLVLITLSYLFMYVCYLLIYILFLFSVVII